ncbi:MAG: alpha/beta hydrolase [Clostridia bacterium]|nr:alpha/beta hydrolase [Clostridia bacterium]
MGVIVNMYKKEFLKRFDKDDAIPYYSAADFPGLVCDEGSFENSAAVLIRYYTYFYGGYDKSRTVLFCPGIGPGHTAYLAEIETICSAGYRVLTLDYTGCGASGGERLTSANAPTRDAVELLALLAPEEEIVPVGHSLGGYTAINVARLTPSVKRTVVISGFVSIADEMIGFVKLPLLANAVKRYEKKLDPRYGKGDNRAYLAATEDRFLWIHSKDDPMVNYRHNAGRVLKMNNPNVRVITVENKRHNPQYTAEALETMNAWMGGYYRLTGEKQLCTPEERKAYFADKPIGRMTGQDPDVYREILRFISGEDG